MAGRDLVFHWRQGDDTNRFGRKGLSPCKDLFFFFKCWGTTSNQTSMTSRQKSASAELAKIFQCTTPPAWDVAWVHGRRGAGVWQDILCFAPSQRCNAIR